MIRVALLAAGIGLAALAVLTTCGSIVRGIVRDVLDGPPPGHGWRHE